MNVYINLVKGIHPGFILERQLRKRKLPKGKFALSINEYPQTIVAITKGRRKMNTALALKIEQALDLEEGFFMILQVFHDINVEKEKTQVESPDLHKLRPVLFWDTDIRKINWQTQKSAIIRRIFERGNEAERSEIMRFYGEQTVQDILSTHD